LSRALADLIAEFPGHACPEAWLAELNLGARMSAFPRLNQDAPLVVYSFPKDNNSVSIS
jgi:hypothetical protein